MRERLAAARTAHLATVRPDGRPHVVVCCFAVAVAVAVAADVAWSAVDGKPKSRTDLQRVRNIEAAPAASLLVDHYDDEDWSALWWVRVDGTARVVADGAEHAAAMQTLRAKYPQYGAMALDGPVVALDIESWRGWP
ncbi:MAG: TIGR03668 family PPOX class F420-dependent oxidoreductase [Acidimicrobiia bacterium]|nr:TIGR03668 family PPOX class F420-dependent oxidoreductase [Acidimicrobiia bacterium]